MMTELPSRKAAEVSDPTVATARPSTTNDSFALLASTSAATAWASRGTISLSGVDPSASSRIRLGEPARASDTVISRRMGEVY